MPFLIFLCLGTLLLLPACAQQTYNVRTIAFYNVENLFDTKNDTLIFDDDRTPEGKYRWTKERYKKKIGRIARVLSDVGQSTTNTTPDIIGLCEIENRSVLEDLVRHPLLRDHDYGIIHFDAPDRRGIDVALLFKNAAYIPTSFKSHRLLLYDDMGKRKYTRDQLVVGGVMDQEEVYYIVNHWPSRRGGAARSQPHRVQAALLNKRIIDSIQRMNSMAKIISMGDLNDDPRDDSLKKILKTTGEKDPLDSISLYNPMEHLHKKGIGSLAYRDKWNLFDQFFMTPNLVRDDKQMLSFWKAKVYAPSYLRTRRGRYKGYPFRTYTGTRYMGGYSDHFPVYLFLVKETL